MFELLLICSIPFIIWIGIFIIINIINEIETMIKETVHDIRYHFSKEYRDQYNRNLKIERINTLKKGIESYYCHQSLYGAQCYDISDDEKEYESLHKELGLMCEKIK